ncbi:MAG: hypothetical protein AVDCRST_MAG74-1619, partial [uncultured Pyrinomonadaceae bacterium]
KQASFSPASIPEVTVRQFITSVVLKRINFLGLISHFQSKRLISDGVRIKPSGRTARAR